MLRDRAPICDSWWPPARLHTPNKQHWIGWLAQYNGPGYYGRKNSNRDARFIYNHINCPPMLIWLAETSGVPKLLIAASCRVASGVENETSACATIRRVLPWEIVESALRKRVLRN
jgi:hypothetical protein